MAMWARWSNTDRIAWCGMSRATLEVPLGNFLLRITPAAAKATANKATTKTYAYFAGHFNGHGNVLVRYRAHRPMEEVQSFTRSHWTPPVGKYLLR